jgi:hypothetical protein
MASISQCVAVAAYGSERGAGGNLRPYRNPTQEVRNTPDRDP